MKLLYTMVTLTLNTTWIALKVLLIHAFKLPDTFNERLYHISSRCRIKTNKLKLTIRQHNNQMTFSVGDSIALYCTKYPFTVPRNHFSSSIEVTPVSSTGFSAPSTGFLALSTGFSVISIEFSVISVAFTVISI